MELTPDQKQNPEVRNWTKRLQHAFTASVLDEIVECYNERGLLFTDSFRVEWNLVPVLALTVADTKEARSQKGVFESYSCCVPRHTCRVQLKDCDGVFVPEELSHRDGAHTVDLCQQLEGAQREGDTHTANAIKEELALESVKPWVNPWAYAPLGVVGLGLLYFSLCWPEVVHQLEGGLIAKATVAVVYLTRRTAVGTVIK